MAFVQNDDVIQALATNGADQTLDIRILPGRMWCRQDFRNAQCGELLPNRLAVKPVAVADQITGSRVKGKRFRQLAGDPFGGRVDRDVEVNDLPAVVAEYDDPRTAIGRSRSGRRRSRWTPTNRHGFEGTSARWATADCGGEACTWRRWIERAHGQATPVRPESAARPRAGSRGSSVRSHGERRDRSWAVPVVLAGPTSSARTNEILHGISGRRSLDERGPAPSASRPRVATSKPRTPDRAGESWGAGPNDAERRVVGAGPNSPRPDCSGRRAYRAGKR